MIDWIKSGKPWIWLSSLAVTVSMLLVLGILLFIGWNGINYFWPQPVYEWQNANGQRVIGEIYQRQQIPLRQLSKQQQAEIPKDLVLDIQSQAVPSLERLVIRIGNRDFYGNDFISTFAYKWSKEQLEQDIIVLNRTKSGPFIGRVQSLVTEQGQFTDRNNFV